MCYLLEQVRKSSYAVDGQPVLKSHPEFDSDKHIVTLFDALFPGAKRVGLNMSWPWPAVRIGRAGMCKTPDHAEVEKASLFGQGAEVRQVAVGDVKREARYLRGQLND